MAEDKTTQSERFVMKNGGFYKETTTHSYIGPQEELIQKISANNPKRIKGLDRIKINDKQYNLDIISKGDVTYVVLESDHMRLKSTVNVRLTTQADVDRIRTVKEVGQPIRYLSFEKEGELTSFVYRQKNCRYFLIADILEGSFRKLYAITKFQYMDGNSNMQNICHATLLPNVYEQSGVCVGDLQTTGSVLDKGKQAISHFLNSRFNMDLYTTEKTAFVTLDSHSHTNYVTKEHYIAMKPRLQSYFKPSLQITDLL